MKTKREKPLLRQSTANPAAQTQESPPSKKLSSSTPKSARSKAKPPIIRIQGCNPDEFGVPIRIQIRQGNLKSLPEQINLLRSLVYQRDPRVLRPKLRANQYTPKSTAFFVLLDCLFTKSPFDFGEVVDQEWHQYCTSLTSALAQVSKHPTKTIPIPSPNDLEKIQLGAIRDVKAFLSLVFKKKVEVRLLQNVHTRHKAITFQILPDAPKQIPPKDPIEAKQIPEQAVVFREMADVRHKVNLLPDRYRRIHQETKNPFILDFTNVFDAHQKHEIIEHPKLKPFCVELTRLSRSGYYFITGNAGVGKTTFITQLIKSNHLHNKYFHQCYFFNYRSAEHNSMSSCLRHLYYALGNLHVQTQEEDKKKHPEITKHDFINRLNKIHDLLLSPKVNKATIKHSENRRKIFIFIDAIDEADRDLPLYQIKNFFPNGSPDEPIPKAIRFILSARNIETLNGLEEICHINLGLWEIDKLETFWKEIVDHHTKDETTRIRLKEQANEVAQKSEGNLLYLSRLPEHLTTMAAHRPLQPTDIPQGIKSLYAEYWSHPAGNLTSIEREEIWKAWRTLALLQEPLPINPTLELSDIRQAIRPRIIPTLIRYLDTHQYTTTGNCSLFH